MNLPGTIRNSSVVPQAPNLLKYFFDLEMFGMTRVLQGIAIGELVLQPGVHVRIRPKARADIMDLALDGKTAVIEAVEQDVEGRIHLALVLPEDRLPGHRFFFASDEVEPLGEQASYTP